MLLFPKDFFWGAATSSYQVEGNNLNSDWWVWEKDAGKPRSGQACRQYELYEEDFNLAQSLSHNSHRLSIEWSRIQPQEGVFSEKEIQHYKDVIASLRRHNLEPVVTLHHFTNPVWFAQKGGWQNKNSPEYFLKYAEKIVDALCDKVSYWVTINEPNVYMYHAYMIGTWPPQKKSLSAAKKVQDNFEIAHCKVYKYIQSVYKKKNLPAASVSFAQNMQAFEPKHNNLINKISAYFEHWFYNFASIQRLKRCGCLDFIGINYYSRNLVDASGWGLFKFLPKKTTETAPGLEKNSLGWEIYPQGLYDLLLRLAKYKLPVFILENGICINDDNKRWDYIRSHLISMHNAMQKGIKVIGYLYWSLIDNFEWDKGFGPRFGLIEVDYSNYKRTVRQSADKFADVCKTSKLE